MGKVLVVDDEPHLRRILLSNLRQEHHEVVEAGGVNDARRALGEYSFDAVITDQKMSDGEGLDVLAAAREADSTLSVVFLTAFATIELAVESMRRGAFDFITKPFVPEVLLASATRAIERTRLVRENKRLRDTVVRLEGSSEIVGQSAPIRRLREQIARVSPTNATVLITGETGTGKELVARAIHRNSPRADKPLVAVNCAFTETLLESELFGHERGAFTGADRAREGVFEAAHEGTLFLDEAAEMSLAAQAKLLRVLTDGLVTRLGSTRARRTDVRLIAATNRNLEQLVKDGRFREDLYYRLAVVPLTTPPLREHREDLPELCALLLEQAVRDLKTPQRRLSVESIRTLVNYDFPGNIRELRNLIERACILSVGEEITPDSFPVTAPRALESPPPPRGLAALTPVQVAEMMPESYNLREFLATLEKVVIQRALRIADGAQAEVARRLGMSRSDLSYKLGKHRIRDGDEP